MSQCSKLNRQPREQMRRFIYFIACTVARFEPRWGDHARASDCFRRQCVRRLGAEPPDSGIQAIHTIRACIHGHGTATPTVHLLAVQRGLKAAAVEYMSLADAHSSKDVAKLHECAEEHAAVFEEDGAADFVQEVIDSFARQNVRGLTNTYYVEP